MSGQPAATLNAAFDKLKQTVSPADATRFQSTTLEDVWKAARDIERVQKQRQSLRNLARIKPLLDGLEKYSRTIEVLCNGTPYLPWVWAPIKFLLQIASGYAHIFDLIVGAYAQIAEALPRFDRFQKAFQDNPNFQNVLAMVYTDILEFHRHAYKIFKRPAWYIVFGSLWRDFESRFTGILESLARHRELVDKEAISIDIAEARSWRIRAEEDIGRRENQRQEQQLHYATGWLCVDDLSQEEELDRLSDRRQDGTCEWVMRSSQLTAWMDGSNSETVIWINGIPGAGKSVLCSHVISALKKARKSTTLYYFCNSHLGNRDLCGTIFRTLALQLVRDNIELASYISDNYAARGLNCSTSQLKELVPNLIKATTATRIVIDGLDECGDKDQKQILQELTKLCGERCKILISSRDGGHIGKVLKKRRIIAFRDRRSDIDNDIRLYVSQTLSELRQQFGDEIIDEIKQTVVEKADGMFLWVRLVIESLLECYSINELREAVIQLPEGLDAAYDRILRRIMTDHNRHASQKAIRILEWIACSSRTLKRYEIQDGVVFTPENNVLNAETKQSASIVELCKPIIEEGPGNTVDFVHYSAKEYILHQVSGPFLSEATAHYNITLSCISYLHTSLSLIDPNIPPEQVRTHVLLGYHGLHRYADEFWTDHLLQYLRLGGVFDVSILEALDDLLQFQKFDLTQGSDNELDRDSVISSLATQLELLSQMSNFPEIQVFVRRLLLFRAQSVMDRKDADKDQKETREQQVVNDPSWFSKVSQAYETIVASLLGESAPVSPQNAELLNQFKKIYGSTAFVCGYYRCPHSSNGFTSAAARDEHESLHTIRYKCPESKCVYSATGFLKYNLLQKHIQQHHGKVGDPVPILSKQRVQKKRRFEDPDDYRFPPTFLIAPHNTNTLQHRLREAEFRHMKCDPHYANSSFNDNHKGTSPFPSGDAARSLAPRKAFIDYDHVTTQSQKFTHATPATLDFVVLENPQIRRPRISERWTITELISFPSLLEYFGSDWKGIAATMKTKTAQMVMNHYNNQVDPGKSEFTKIIEIADQKPADRKAANTVPPAQTQQRRIYDRNSVALFVRDTSPPKSSTQPIINIVDGPFVGDVEGGREDLPEPIINAPALPDLVGSLEVDESTSGLASVIVKPFFPSSDDWPYRRQAEDQDGQKAGEKQLDLREICPPAERGNFAEMLPVFPPPTKMPIMPSNNVDMPNQGSFVAERGCNITAARSAQDEEAHQQQISRDQIIAGATPLQNRFGHGRTAEDKKVAGNTEPEFNIDLNIDTNIKLDTEWDGLVIDWNPPGTEENKSDEIGYSSNSDNGLDRISVVDEDDSDSDYEVQPGKKGRNVKTQPKAKKRVKRR